MAQIPIPGPNVTRESSSNSESSDMTDTIDCVQSGRTTGAFDPSRFQ